MVRILVALLPLYLAGCSVIGMQGDTEQPPYAVVASLPDDIEIRQYAERVAVEVTVTGDDADAARNAAFRLLFAYISGANRTDTDIAMTAPVETRGDSRTIAMTAPVESRVGEAGATTMRFFLPARFTLETAPEPTDGRVRLVALPAQRFAVLTFSGSRSRQAVSGRLQQLHAALDARGLEAMRSSERAFFYDPPWTLPWFRRNEVAIEVINSF